MNSRQEQSMSHEALKERGQQQDSAATTTTTTTTKTLNNYNQINEQRKLGPIKTTSCSWRRHRGDNHQHQHQFNWQRHNSQMAGAGAGADGLAQQVSGSAQALPPLPPPRRVNNNIKTVSSSSSSSQQNLADSCDGGSSDSGHGSCWYRSTTTTASCSGNGAATNSTAGSPYASSYLSSSSIASSIVNVSSSSAASASSNCTGQHHQHQHQHHHHHHHHHHQQQQQLLWAANAAAFKTSQQQKSLASGGASTSTVAEVSADQQCPTYSMHNSRRKNKARRRQISVGGYSDVDGRSRSKSNSGEDNNDNDDDDDDETRQSQRTNSSSANYTMSSSGAASSSPSPLTVSAAAAAATAAGILVCANRTFQVSSSHHHHHQMSSSSTSSCAAGGILSSSSCCSSAAGSTSSSSCASTSSSSSSSSSSSTTSSSSSFYPSCNLATAHHSSVHAISYEASGSDNPSSTDCGLAIGFQAQALPLVSGQVAATAATATFSMARLPSTLATIGRYQSSSIRVSRQALGALGQLDDGSQQAVPDCAKLMHHQPSGDKSSPPAVMLARTFSSYNKQQQRQRRRSWLVMSANSLSSNTGQQSSRLTTSQEEEEEEGEETELYEDDDDEHDVGANKEAQSSAKTSCPVTTGGSDGQLCQLTGDSKRRRQQQQQEALEPTIKRTSADGASEAAKSLLNRALNYQGQSQGACCHWFVRQQDNSESSSSSSSGSSANKARHVEDVAGASNNNKDNNDHDCDDNDKCGQECGGDTMRRKNERLEGEQQSSGAARNNNDYASRPPFVAKTTTAAAIEGEEEGKNGESESMNASSRARAKTSDQDDDEERRQQLAWSPECAHSDIRDLFKSTEQVSSDENEASENRAKREEHGDKPSELVRDNGEVREYVDAYQPTKGTKFARSEAIVSGSKARERDDDDDDDDDDEDNDRDTPAEPPRIDAACSGSDETDLVKMGGTIRFAKFLEIPNACHSNAGEHTTARPGDGKAKGDRIEASGCLLICLDLARQDCDQLERVGLLKRANEATGPAATNTNPRIRLERKVMNELLGQLSSGMSGDERLRADSAENGMNETGPNERGRLAVSDDDHDEDYDDDEQNRLAFASVHHLHEAQLFIKLDGASGASDRGQWRRRQLKRGQCKQRHQPDDESAKWLLAPGNSASPHPSRSSSSSSLSSPPSSPFPSLSLPSTPTSSDSDSASSGGTPKRGRANKLGRVSERGKKLATRASFWRLVASATDSDDSSTSGSGSDSSGKRGDIGRCGRERESSDSESSSEQEAADFGAANNGDELRNEISRPAPVLQSLRHPLQQRRQRHHSVRTESNLAEHNSSGGGGGGAVEATSMACPLAKFIREADLDPNNRPKLIWAERELLARQLREDSLYLSEQAAPVTPRPVSTNSELDEETQYSTSSSPNLLRLNSIDEQEEACTQQQQQQQQEGGAGPVSGTAAVTAARAGTLGTQFELIAKQERRDTVGANNETQQRYGLEINEQKRRPQLRRAASGQPCRTNETSPDSGEEEEGEEHIAAAAPSEHDELSVEITATRGHQLGADDLDGRRGGDTIQSTAAAGAPAADCLKELGEVVDQETEGADEHKQRLDSADKDNRAADEADDDDDDYFYDDELSFGHKRLIGNKPLPPAGGAATTSAMLKRLAESQNSYATANGRVQGQPWLLGGQNEQQQQPLPQTDSGEASSASAAARLLLAHLSASSSARPLLVWAPSARRVSCPVGQLGSFSSWRQLWPALPPLPAPPTTTNNNRGSPLVCANCLGQAGGQPMPCQQQADLATATQTARIHHTQRQPAQRGAASSPIGAASIGTFAPPNNDRSSSSSQAIINRTGGGGSGATETSLSSRASLACSDYFSSFDQTTNGATSAAMAPEQTIGQQPQPPQQTGDIWADVLAFEAAKRLTMQLGGACHAPHTAIGAGQPPTANCRRLNQGPPWSSSSSSRQSASSQRQYSHGHARHHNQDFVPPLELRRQSTITGFDHQRYTAPRSPSLCLPHHQQQQQQRLAPASRNGGGGPLSGQLSSQHGQQQHHYNQHLQQQQHGGSAFTASGSTLGPPSAYASSGRLLSPTHSNGGSSSPSPTSWHQQNASAMASAAQQYYQAAANQRHLFNHHQAAGASSRCPQAGSRGGPAFGRARLESLESDRGSSPSWSASTSSLRSSIGGGSSIYSALNLANMMAASQQQQQQHQQARKRSSGSICSNFSSYSSSGAFVPAPPLLPPTQQTAATTSSSCCPACQQQLNNNKAGAKSSTGCTCSHSQQQQMGAQLLQQLRQEILDEKLLLTGSGQTHNQSVAGQQQQQQLSSGLLLPQLAQSVGLRQFDGVHYNQEQAVYFFLCCCRGNNSDQESGGDGAAEQRLGRAAILGPDEQEQRARAAARAATRAAQERQSPRSLLGTSQLAATEPVPSTSAQSEEPGANDYGGQKKGRAGDEANERQSSPRSEREQDFGQPPSEAAKKRQQQQQDKGDEQTSKSARIGRRQQEGDQTTEVKDIDNNKEEEDGNGDKDERQRVAAPAHSIGLQSSSSGSGGELRAHLSALLDQFDRISETPRQLDATERQLLAALEQRILAQARLQLEPAVGSGGGGGGGPLSLLAPSLMGEQAVAVVGEHQGQLDQQQQQQQQRTAATPGTSRADTMRYSTPNLLLSSNFELLLRQQDRRVKQEERDQNAAAEGPPEATEAWFLSKSPVSGAQSGAASSSQLGGSRESIRRSLGHQGRSFAKGSDGDRSLLARLGTSFRRQSGRELASRDDDDVGAGGGADDDDDDESLSQERRRSTVSMQSKTRPDKREPLRCMSFVVDGGGGGGGGGGSGGGGGGGGGDGREPIVKQPARQGPIAPGQEMQIPRPGQLATGSCQSVSSGRPHLGDSERQLTPSDSERALASSPSRALASPRISRTTSPIATASVTLTTTAKAPTATPRSSPTGSGGDKKASAEQELAAEPQSPRNLGGGFPVHDKSMAQARYLYSTLTSNAGALLAAVISSPATISSSAASAAATTTAATTSATSATTSSTGSGTGATDAGATRAGASKVTNKLSASACSSSGASPTRPVRKQAQFVVVAERKHKETIKARARSSPPPPSSVEDGQRQRQTDEGQPTSSSSNSGELVSGGLQARRRRKRLETLARVKSGGKPEGGGGGNSSSDDSSSDQDESGDKFGGYEIGAEKSGSEKRDFEAESRRRKARADESEFDIGGEEEDEDEEDIVDSFTTTTTPAIIESVCEQRRRSSQTSRSISIDVTQAQPLQAQQQQQQLQPAMDPEMHALWAQGADLDTGNGNFIQATRRRRSVHAIHQVQLHQQQQQQQQQQQHQQMKGKTLYKAMSHVSQTSGESEVGVSGSASYGGGSGPLNLPLTVVGFTSVDSHNLKDKLKKLRSTSSIEESHQHQRHAHQSLAASHRTRFVSDPASATAAVAQGTGSGGGGGGSCMQDREGSTSSWATRKSEPLIGSKLDELTDDELAEEVAAADESAGIRLEADDDDDDDAALIYLAGDRMRRNDDTGGDELDDDVLVDDDDAAAAAAAADQKGQRELLLQRTASGSKRARLGTADEGEGAGELTDEDDGDGDADDYRRVFYLTDAEYDLDELESNSSMLASLFQWNYPIFDLVGRYGQTILSKLSYRIFFDSGFFDSFKIPKQAFFSFFHALEEGYLDKPYHNRLHAADVLHAVYYLTSQPIDNFCQVPLDLIDLYDNLLATTRPRGASEDSDEGEFMSKLHNHIVAIVVAAAAAAADSELPFGIMGANLTALEVMALYTAAAMHDFQHPGRTNSFLVATNSPLALLYNDRSVLENHHSAAAWALFYSGPNLNWLCNLEKDEFKRFRFMIIELILATDLMRHYELVSAFNKKLNNVGRHNIDWFCESDRLLVMEIIIKLADVNGPMKGHELHCQWTDRIAMEFYEQGDEERALGLPVSLYMDRSDPRLPELQKSFINHLVGPLSHSYAAAGFFPKSSEPILASAGDDVAGGHLEQQRQDDRSGAAALAADGGAGEDVTDESGTQETVYNQVKYWLIEDSPNGRSKLNKRFLNCVQTMNLRNNFLYWDAKSKEKQQQQQQQQLEKRKQSTTSASSSIDQSNID